MRIVFMGTPEYAIAPLGSLLEAPSSEIVGVYTQPDRPAGRGGATTPPPVGRYSRERGLPLFQPAGLRDAAVQHHLAALEPDILVVAAYGKILPNEVLQIPRNGCLNIHPSLLPRHRGPSPVVTAILDGDQTTGVTVMVVDEGMDSGPIVAQVTTDIGQEETADTLTHRLFLSGGDLLCSVLPQWVSGDLNSVGQDESRVTLTRKITKQDGEADWELRCEQLVRKARAFDPWPGLFTYWKGKMLKLTKIRPLPRSADDASSWAVAGTVLNIQGGTPAIVTGSGLLALDELQLEGRRPVSAGEFVRGQRDFVGSVLPS